MSNNASEVSTDDASSLVISDQMGTYMENKIHRSNFPSDFIFGAGTSAYQVEGAWATGGKGPSNWDVWCLKTPGHVDGGNNGCVAIDEYNLCKEDVALLKKTGFDSYRLSISWTRVLPGGTLSCGINRDGTKYYNYLIDMLLAEDIVPCVTIFHWDIPQCLEDEYGGFLSPRIVRDYCDFAELCFWEFGDRVKIWVTINEAWSYTVSGYVTGIFPPGRGGVTPAPVSAIPRHRYRQQDQSTITTGNTGTEPYIVGHHLILAHAAAVEIYRTRFQALQGGKIGMTNVAMWFEPYTSTSSDDTEACTRALDFMFGWFVTPLVFGEYPSVMRQNVGARLPTFTPEQVKLVRGSYDFLGVNYYTTNYVYNYTPKASEPTGYETDQHLKMTGTNSAGHAIGPQPSENASWLYLYPIGIYDLLTYINTTYGNPIVYITENGIAEDNNTALTVSQARLDWTRIQAYQDHFSYVKQASNRGAKVKGFYIWAMFDNFEWANAYSVRFGTFFIDYVNGRLTRIPKVSALWFTNFLNNALPSSKERPKEIESKKQAKENEGQTVSAKRPRRN